MINFDLHMVIVLQSLHFFLILRVFHKWRQSYSRRGARILWKVLKPISNKRDDEGRGLGGVKMVLLFNFLHYVLCGRPLSKWQGATAMGRSFKVLTTNQGILTKQTFVTLSWNSCFIFDFFLIITNGNISQHIINMIA